MTRFSQRSEEREWMDEPGLGTPELERTLTEIEALNHHLGGYRPSLDGLQGLIRGRSWDRPVRVLDVGTGGADTPRMMLAWAAERGLRLEITAIDSSEATIDFARRRAEGTAGLELRCQDLFELPVGERFDVVHAALVLHHFPGASAIRALAAMFERAELGLVVNDLHRHPVAWAGIQLIAHAFSRNPMLHNDAPLSVLRAFEKSELLELARQAGLPEARVSWRPMFRWQMVVERRA